MFAWLTRKRDLDALDNRIFKLESALMTAEYRIQHAQAVADDAGARLAALTKYLKVRFRSIPARGPDLEVYDGAIEEQVEHERFFPGYIKDQIHEAQANLRKAAQQ